MLSTDQFLRLLKYNMLHCYLYLFVLFPFKLFLFQAESMKARFDAMVND